MVLGWVEQTGYDETPNCYCSRPISSQMTDMEGHCVAVESLAVPGCYLSLRNGYEHLHQRWSESKKVRVQSLGLGPVPSQSPARILWNIPAVVSSTDHPIQQSTRPGCC